MPDPLNFNRAVLLAPPVIPTVNGILSLTLLRIVKHPGWEVLGVGCIYLGGWDWLLIITVWILWWFIGVIHKLLLHSNTNQYLCILEFMYGPPSRCEEVVIFLQDHCHYFLWCKFLVFLPITLLGIHIVPGEWARGWGVHIQFMPNNFWVSITCNKYIVHPFRDMEVCLGGILFETIHICGLQFCLNVRETNASV